MSWLLIETDNCLIYNKHTELLPPPWLQLMFFPNLQQTTQNYNNFPNKIPPPWLQLMFAPTYNKLHKTTTISQNKIPPPSFPQIPQLVIQIKFHISRLKTNKLFLNINQIFTFHFIKQWVKYEQYRTDSLSYVKPTKRSYAQ